MNRVCILFHRLGPYHGARLEAAAGVASVVAIELAGKTDEYAWAPVDEPRSFARVTLFPSEDSRYVPRGELSRRVYRALDEHDPDVVAIPGWSEKGALAALAWCVRRRRPAIVMSETQGADAERRWGKEAIKRRVVGLCAAGLVGGTPHRRYLVELGMASERIFTGYDVVDNEHFARGAETARRQAGEVRARLKLPEEFFLASNRFLPKKNLFRLVEAFASYRRRAGGNAWDLVLLGDGPLRFDLLAYCHALGLDGCIHFPGFKQYEELPAYYGLAGAFIHASTTEQWGLVVNEAMAAGLPVLVSERCGCVADLVAPGRNGFTFDPSDTAALTGLMLQIAGDKARRAALGRESVEIISDWTPRHFAEGLREAADCALAQPRRSGGLVDQAILQTLLAA